MFDDGSFYLYIIYIFLLFNPNVFFLFCRPRHNQNSSQVFIFIIFIYLFFLKFYYYYYNYSVFSSSKQYSKYCVFLAAVNSSKYARELHLCLRTRNKRTEIRPTPRIRENIIGENILICCCLPTRSTNHSITKTNNNMTSPEK